MAMTTRLNITTNKATNRTAARWFRVLVLAAVVSALALAHGGYEHVRGTVAKVVNNVLTVKTAKGTVDVKLDNSTELTMNDQKAQVADLKPGARVIVDVPEGSKDKVAKSVKIGGASKTVDANAHGSHK